MRRFFALAAAAAFVLVPAASATADNPIPGGDGGGIDVDTGNPIADAISGVIINKAIICPPTSAPDIETPTQGSAGFFMDDKSGAQKIPGPVDPDHLWSSGGAGGLYSVTYDLGCGTDPDTWSTKLIALGNKNATNSTVDLALEITAAGDSIERKAYDPSWILGAVQSFARRATDTINAQILIPFLVLGVLLTMVVVTWRGRRGDLTHTFAGTAWAVLVIVVTAGIAAAPAAASLQLQKAVSTEVSVLNGGGQASSASTDRIMRTVHYNSFLRRVVGTDDAATAAKYGPALVEAKRWSYAEQAEVAADPGRKATLAGQKAVLWRDTAKAASGDPKVDYAQLQGRRPTVGAAWLEVGFALSASFFRIFAAALLVVCVVWLVVLALRWLVAAVYIMIPAGEEHGRALLNAAGRAFAYALGAALCSWGWGVWCEVALAPGLSGWFSALLLLVGLVIFWSILRPERKMLSVISGGRVSGASRTAKWLGNKLADYALTRHAVREGTRDFEAKPDRVTSEEYRAPAPPVVPMPRAELGPAPRVVHEGTVHDPAPAPASVALYEHTVIYHRPSTDEGWARPMPPPGGSGPGVDLDLYSRSAS